MEALTDKTAKIFVTGHLGMVGTAFLKYFKQHDYQNIITRSREELDLRDSSAVKSFFEKERPDIVLLIAAKVGGIAANMHYPYDFLHDNLQIEANLIQFSRLCAVKKLFFFGSSCIYPKDCPQPMKEEYLLTGPLEPTNEGYAIAKIAGLRMAQYAHKQYGLQILSVMPSNLYGPNDSFDPEHSHVLSALVRKFCDAVKKDDKTVVLWGSGIARREFLHVDDLIAAVLFLDKTWESSDMINVGPGVDISIRDLALRIAEIVNFHGKIEWDTTKPDGMLRKCMDVTRLNNLGFKTDISLDSGLKETIAEYRGGSYRQSGVKR